MIRPEMPKGWIVVTLGESSHKISGILGLLVRLHWPGMVQVGEEEQVSTMWEHYVRTLDQMDPMGRTFNNKEHHMVQELWDFYRCDEGYQDLANRMVSTQCKKMVKDMIYEARIQAVVTYNAKVNKLKITKKEAKNMWLTNEQYEMVIPWWAAKDQRAWSVLVEELWCKPSWEEEHFVARERRLMMQGPAHHQGSRTLSEYMTTWLEGMGFGP